jgi:hypothetical protein
LDVGFSSSELSLESVEGFRVMKPVPLFLVAALVAVTSVAHADDGLGLKRGGDASEVSISGISSGAAMAVQYAVGHSSSITGVGSIAGPPWGCADGSASQAINTCMCARQDPGNKIASARQLAATGKIDSLSASSKPLRLGRSYVFQSPADATVVEKAGKASAAFLSAFIGSSPEIDFGNAADGSDKAGHGIIAPDSHNESCQFDGHETTYVRTCGAEDNAGKLFHALYDNQNLPFDPSQRVSNIAESEVWQFDQKHLIDGAKPGTAVAPDTIWGFWWFVWTFSSERRKNFDMAEKGYIYVPPSCRVSGSSCRVHVALHGCKQDVKDFANKAGYNNWAEHYKVIVVYPAIQPSLSLSGEACQTPIDPVLDAAPIEINPNGCWDWWGYLDTAGQKNRYLTKAAPQMRVIEGIITEVTQQ